MPKWAVYLIFICLYLLITFFGLGPVLLADGSRGERAITLLAVLLLYAAVSFAFWRMVRRRGR